MAGLKIKFSISLDHHCHHHVVVVVNDHMSIPHDGTSCTGTDTDSVRTCTVSGWLQHPRFSGKIHSAKQINFFQRSILNAQTGIEPTTPRV
jgi:hypothetical protein